MTVKATAALSALMVLLAGPALAQSTDTSWWAGGWGMNMAYGGVMMVIVWGGLIVLAIVLARYLVRGPDRESPAPRQSPLDVLQERFARGDIDQQEYETRRRVLNEQRR